MLQIFISHASADADIALAVPSWIRVTFLGGVNVFVSSDGQSISPGDDWRGKIEEALRDADIALVICTASSLSRLWLGFDAGFCLCIQAPNNQSTPGDPNDGSQALGFSIELPMTQQTTDKRCCIILSKVHLHPFSAHFVPNLPQGYPPAL